MLFVVVFAFVLLSLLLLYMLNLMNDDCRLVALTTRLHVTNRAVCLHGLGQGQLFLLAYICSSDNANGKVRYFKTQLHLGQAFRNRNSSSSFEMATLFFLFLFFFFFCFLHLDLYLSKTYSGQREVNEVK